MGLFTLVSFGRMHKRNIIPFPPSLSKMAHAEGQKLFGAVAGRKLIREWKQSL